MYRFILLAVSAIALAVLPTLASATTVFDFYETGITECAPGGTCVPPPAPYLLMSLALSSGSETGSAIYGPMGSTNPPVVTDPGFTFELSGSPVVRPPYFGEPPGCPYSGICALNYAITWTAANDTLTSLSLCYLDNFNEAGSNDCRPGGVYFGLSGGLISSDGSIGGCGNNSCTVTGYWADPVPEPASAALFLAGIFGLVWVRRHPRMGGHRRARLPK